MFNFSLTQLSNQPITWQLLQCTLTSIQNIYLFVCFCLWNWISE